MITVPSVFSPFLSFIVPNVAKFVVVPSVHGSPATVSFLKCGRASIRRILIREFFIGPEEEARRFPRRWRGAVESALPRLQAAFS